MIASIMGVLDQRFYGSSPETMLLQASTKKTQWESRCKAREAKLTQKAERQLAKLKHEIAPLDSDHQIVLAEISNRVKEISSMPGVCEEAKNNLVQKAHSEFLYYSVEIAGRTKVLSLYDIKTSKQLICSKANKIITARNQKCQSVNRKFECKFADYIRSINKSNVYMPVELGWDREHSEIPLWEYNSPASNFPDREYDSPTSNFLSKA